MSRATDDVALALQTGLGQLTRRMRQRHLADLNHTESITLARLAQGGPSSAAGLAREEGISPQSMGATLDRLAERGLVERHQDPADGRRWLVDLTAAGRRRAAEKRSARARQLSEALHREFDAGELAQLRAAAPLLERLAEAIE